MYYEKVSKVWQYSDVDNGKWRDVDIERYDNDHPKAGQPTGIIKEDVVFRSNDQFNYGETEEQTLKYILDGLDFCLKQVEKLNVSLITFFPCSLSFFPHESDCHTTTEARKSQLWFKLRMAKCTLK